MIKKYVYYLPQFHEIPENNEWWGKGFTEWTNVKKAKSLFKGHKQPVHPKDNNYYCLDNPETLRWQAEIAKTYHIDGMIFYHYYFCGKKLLEKPAELLLKNKDIPMNFFFCWANHTWFRSWEGKKTVLIEQTYGNEEDWNLHFEYLLPFFKDERYQKKNNKPLLSLYDSSIPNKDQIISFFDKRCKESGFDGICVIEKYNGCNNETIEKCRENSSCCTEFITYREPDAAKNLYLFDSGFFARRLCRKVHRLVGRIFKIHVDTYDGETLYNVMINSYQNCSDIIPGLFFEWDNTPRHDYRGYIIKPPTQKTFMRYMDKIRNSEYVFINAWNEWCEGMMLEPTEENGYKYLEWIKEWSEHNENRIDGI